MHDRAYYPLLQQAFNSSNRKNVIPNIPVVIQLPMTIYLNINQTSYASEYNLNCMPDDIQVLAKWCLNQTIRSQNSCFPWENY